jgi:hypothetical protein
MQAGAATQNTELNALDQRPETSPAGQSEIRRLNQELRDLQALRRSRYDFETSRLWRPGIFYFLYGLAFAGFVGVLLSVMGHLGLAVVWTLGSVGVVVLLPLAVKHILLLLSVTLPNKRLQKRVDLIKSKILDLKSAPLPLIRPQPVELQRAPPQPIRSTPDDLEERIENLCLTVERLARNGKTR